MLQLVTILSADSDCTNQVPIQISFCFGHRQSGLVAERSVGEVSLQLLKPLVRSLKEIIPLGFLATKQQATKLGNNNSTIITSVAAVV